MNKRGGQNYAGFFAKPDRFSAATRTTAMNTAPTKPTRKSARQANAFATKRAKYWRFTVPLSIASRTLGVDESHLRRVLLGERNSPELLAKYRALAG